VIANLMFQVNGMHVRVDEELTTHSTTGTYSKHRAVTDKLFETLKLGLTSTFV
jgi:hypothetical protein